MPEILVIISPAAWLANLVPNLALLTLTLFEVLLAPTPEIFIISSLICTKSPPKNEVTPTNSIISVVESAVVFKELVIAVETTGLWIILSIVIRTLEFCLVVNNLCEVPLPTLVMLIKFGFANCASTGLVANPTKVSSILTINRFSMPLGRASVNPIPVIKVSPIPIAEVTSLMSFL